MRRYGHFKFFQHGGGRHVGFVRTGNSAITSAVPKNPILEPNMKCIRSAVTEIRPFVYLGGHMEPPFWGRGGRRGSPFERAMVFSYRLSIVTVALSVTTPLGCNLRSNISDTQINRGWVTLGQNFGVLPLEQTPDVGVYRERSKAN